MGHISCSFLALESFPINVCFKEPQSWNVPTGSLGSNPHLSVEERGLGRRKWLTQGHVDHQWCGWEKNPGLLPPGLALLFSPWEQVAVILLKIETFLRDVFDSPQRSSALTFVPCLSQGKCLSCKSEIRSRVVPLGLQVFKYLCFCPLWLFLMALLWLQLFKEMPAQSHSPKWEFKKDTYIQFWLAAFLKSFSSRSEKNSLGCIFCQAWSQIIPAWTAWHMCNPSTVPEKRCRVAAMSHLQRGMPHCTGHWARSLADIFNCFNFLKFLLH